MSVTYLETGSQNPYYNLAFEEFVLTHRLEGEYLLLWQNDNTIVVGQNQNTEAEINRAFMWCAGPPAAAPCITTWGISTTPSSPAWATRSV